ncbi:ribosome maturation factor RimM [bacterium BMS3Abin07]|nr:ribosome maturation factor RimM [bacterium BMS3Abin07]GBE32581.1 ribosome maturation factor RimM [bacterium BMS3Bbin05]HDO21307.1 16S rRNA processing protein RimM [Nitrospirota bacterium]HDZ88850.1 16S rRNA processing protein RimM [Nitrospirota bacterium]
MKSWNKNRLVTIGKIAKPKGVGSQLRVLPLTYDPKRFLDLSYILIEKDGKLTKKTIENTELSGKYIYLECKEIKSNEECRLYTGCEIRIPESESPEPPEGSYYHYQIIGLEVYTDAGRYLGKVNNILETGSNDVYSVVDNDREVLIPAIEDVIMEIDIKGNRIVIHPVKGLLSDI